MLLFIGGTSIKIELIGEKVLAKLSAKGTMAYISVSRGRLRCALQSKLPLVSLDNLGGLHFNFVGKNIERKKQATSRECLQFTLHRKIGTVMLKS